MTKLPGKAVLPITPTADETGAPTTCRACGRVAIGIGVGFKHKGDDPSFLCKGCLVAVSDLSKFDRLSLFELKALDAGVEAVGEWIEQRGNGTDLQYFDSLDQRMLVKAAWEGCIRGVREALKEAPF
jgi:hypothetical protein